ncbi:hypothetical protein ACFL43_02505, partial [Thermodesulfobacteriota bacterium]
MLYLPKFKGGELDGTLPTSIDDLERAYDYDIYGAALEEPYFFNFGYDVDVVCPTLIELKSFDVSPANKKNTLHWITESETDNAGFNIFRANSKDGDYEQLNDSTIPATGSPAQGAEYNFT